MKLRVVLLVFCAVLSVDASGDGLESNDGNSTEKVEEIGWKLILTKFDDVSSKLQNIEGKLQTLEEQTKKTESMQLQLQNIENKLQKIENEIHKQRSSQNEMLVTLQTPEDHVALNVSEQQNQNQEKLHSALQNLDRDVGRVLQNQNNVIPSSCKDILSVSNISGTYMIRVNTDSEPFRVYCEQQVYDGGWIVIQHRFNGSLDFYRDWNEYRDGFGDLENEFWLGLEKIHQITKARKHELIVELKDFDGEYKYARYAAFGIGNGSEEYALKHLGMYYDGTAGPGMWLNKGMKFSTKDRDNDEHSSEHCAQVHEGAWWYNACSDANLNGRYLNAQSYKSMIWYDFDDDNQGLAYSRMMIRQLE
ncbi:ficolin-1-like [Anopheles aquasalis]|uniref:ficolin-1-like n=1 Tax=Anopheles aquasalis TaxID=42839 RepID=UPI00215B6025|nr:ficolin-1-like [Anopheles aquasalis]